MHGIISAEGRPTRATAIGLTPTVLTLIASAISLTSASLATTETSLTRRPGPAISMSGRGRAYTPKTLASLAMSAPPKSTDVPTKTLPLERRATSMTSASTRPIGRPISQTNHGSRRVAEPLPTQLSA